MKQFITIHNAKGEAVFDQSSSDQPQDLAIPPGTISVLYSTSKFIPDLSQADDIEEYRKQKSSVFFEGTRRNCPDTGTVANILSLKPGNEPAMHRTMTLDLVYVLSGQVEITLDSGEQEVLSTGDSLVQRGTAHSWRNVTPDNGWAKMLVFIQPVQDPIKVAGKELTSDWKIQH